MWTSPGDRSGNFRGDMAADPADAKKMRYASIDIGTNTLRLLIAEVERGAIKPLFYKRAITRLGGAYTPEEGIDRESAGRSIEALALFKSEIDEFGAGHVFATATSVVRRAKNQAWFLEEVRKRTGIKVSVISGGEEAGLALLGVLSVLSDRSPRRLVFDIGGGSTEFIATSGPDMAGAWSMEMGVVHLSEKYLKHDPPGKGDLAAIDKEVAGVITELKARMKKAKIDPEMYSGKNGAALVGTAGTITTLAAMEQDLEVYDRSRINNFRLKKERVEELYKYLCGLTLKERELVLTLEKGREDLIIPGAAITLAVMDAFGADELLVSDAGLLEGILIHNARQAAPAAGLTR